MNISNCTVIFKINSLTKQQFLAIAQRGVNTEYNPRRFHAIIMRIRTASKTVAALIFQSSRIVLTGVPHPAKAQKFANKVLRESNTLKTFQ